MSAVISRHIAHIFPTAVALRRTVHKHPELSGEERQTAALVYDSLKRLGLSPKFFVHKTGVVAYIRNGSGPTIALRADMDALPIQEENRVPFCSVKPGVMHACGHDMHVASLLGAAELLLQLKEYWKGTVALLFQPTEEANPGGAIQLINEGAYPKDAVAVFGLHCSIDHPTGSVGIHPGVDHAGVIDFDLVVRGRGGHGAMPHQCVDPIVCASQIITAMQTLVSRGCPPYEPAVVTIGTFNAGTKRNIIPDEAVLTGTIRSLTDARQNALKKSLSLLAAQIAEGMGASAYITWCPSYPPLFNDPATVTRITPSLGAMLGKAKVIARKTISMGAEDFAYYARLTPGVFLHMGVCKPGVTTMPGLHTSRFLPDEAALKTGMAIHAALALEYLGIKK